MKAIISKKNRLEYIKRYNLKKCEVLLQDVTETFRIVNNQTRLPRFKYKCYICFENFISYFNLLRHKTKFKNNACKEFTNIRLKASRNKKQKRSDCNDKVRVSGMSTLAAKNKTCEKIAKIKLPSKSSTSKRLSQPKPRTPQPKIRHNVPDTEEIVSLEPVEIVNFFDRDEIVNLKHEEFANLEQVEIVNLEHGYVMSNVETIIEEQDVDGNILLMKTMAPFTDKGLYIRSKAGIPQPERHHEVPHFSPTNDTFINANVMSNVESIFEEEDIESSIILKRNRIFEEEDIESNIILKRNLALPTKPSTKKRYTRSKPRTPQPKRRQKMPDFSATNYAFINANEEVNVSHYKCLRCEQLFINKIVFFRHIEKGKCYINNCDMCTATFTKNSEFYEHYIANHMNRAICNFCFTTMYPKNMKEHRLRHLDQFMHRCQECNKGFFTTREYRSHYKSRHMNIRHKCEVCGKNFVDIKRHIAAHTKANLSALQIINSRPEWQKK